MNVLMNQVIYLNYKKMIVQNIQLFIYQFINSLDSTINLQIVNY